MELTCLKELKVESKEEEKKKISANTLRNQKQQNKIQKILKNRKNFSYQIQFSRSDDENTKPR